MIEIKKSIHEHSAPIVIDGEQIGPDQHAMVKIAVGKTPSESRLSIQAHIYRGKNPGPCILVLGGVHGDEINGIEIVNQMIYDGQYDDIENGSIIAVPLLNVNGFNNFSRDMPDGKDVNRSFPGILNGSQAARVARTLTKHILPYVDYAIDLHTGGDSRYNYPQTRYTKSDKVSRQMADVFNAPFTIQQPLISKSFRKTCKEMAISSLVYEGGESIRLCGVSIQYGKEGILRVMDALNLFATKKSNDFTPESTHVIKSAWIRAQQSGIFIWSKSSGNLVEKGEPIGTIKNPYGTKKIVVLSKYTGHIIGHNNASVVNQGDALFHIGILEETLSNSQTF